MPKRAVPLTAAERKRQSSTLRDLRKESGLDLTPAAARIGVSASQLTRYESGETLLPSNLYSAVSATYGIRTADLVVALGLLDRSDIVPVPVCGWDAYAALRDIGLDEDDARQRADIIVGRPVIDQRQYVDGLAKLIRESREQPTNAQNRRLA